MDILCYCGGDEYIHFVGSEKCNRVLTEPPIKNIDGTWEVDGVSGITDRTLKEQWGYYQHKNNRWSKYKDMNPSNSLEREI